MKRVEELVHSVQISGQAVMAVLNLLMVLDLVVREWRIEYHIYKTQQ